MYNYETVARMGETGFVMTTPLIDEDGPVDLNAWAGVVMNIKTRSGVSIVTSQPSTIVDADTGTISNTIDITTAAWPNMRVGEHRIVYTATDPSGNLHTFPKSKKHPYGILIVLAAL